MTRWRHDGHAACTNLPAQALHMVWPQGNSATTFANSKQTGHSAEAPEGVRCGASSCSGTPGHEAFKLQMWPPKKTLGSASQAENPRAVIFARKHFVTASNTPCILANAMDMLSALCEHATCTMHRCSSFARNRLASWLERFVDLFRNPCVNLCVKLVLDDAARPTNRCCKGHAL